MGKDIKNGLTIIRLTRSSVGSRFNEIDYFVIENEEKFQFDLRKIRLYSFQRMYDYQFTSYIYIYIDEPRARYVKRISTIASAPTQFQTIRTPLIFDAQRRLCSKVLSPSSPFSRSFHPSPFPRLVQSLENRENRP